jgi:hypothetical protein
MRVVIECGRVTVDEIEYLPKSLAVVPPPFTLTDDHFEAVAKNDNAFELVRWAYDQKADVETMLAWGRSMDFVLPLPEVKKPKPVKTLFGGGT